MVETTQVFRFSVRLLIWAAIGHAFLTILVLGAVWLAGREVNPVYLGLFALVPAVIWLVIFLCLRVTVEAGGLRWVNLDGAATGVAWSQIGRAEFAREFGLPFLSLWMADGDGPYHVPLLLSDIEGFKEAVAEVIDADHPVARALSQLA